MNLVDNHAGWVDIARQITKAETAINNPAGNGLARSCDECCSGNEN